MAKFKPKLPLIDDLITKKPPTAITEISNVGSKIMRFKVLADRETRGFQKADVNGPVEAFEHGPRGIFQSNKKSVREEAIGYTHEIAGKRQPALITNNMTDKISIIDIDALKVSNPNQSYEYIELPFVPRELNYSMSSKFVGIATLGRNNPYYQFTGSEDTLSFEIDWFSNQLDRRDVINSCRWIEALTKSDSYNHPPHRIILSWGADNLLWIDDIWLVTSAAYRLSDFNRGYRRIKNIGKGANYDPQGEFISTSMLPQQAFQTIVLKRLVSINRSREDIINKI